MRLLFPMIFAVLTVPASLALSAPAGDLVVMTYNIRFDNPLDGADAWSERRGEVASFVARQKADAIGLQEAVEGQVAFLGKELTDFAWYGVGRDDGRAKGEFAPLFYRRERFDLENKGTIWLSETPDVVGSKGWDAALPRVATWLRLKDKTTGTAFLVANAHFDHRGAKSRVESGKLLRRRLAELADGAPVVLIGDFNVTPKSDAYDAIAGERGDKPADERAGVVFRDARKLVDKPLGPDTTWNGFKEPMAGQLIDHIFVDRQWQVSALAVLDEKRKNGRFLSDHFPIIATLRLEGTP